MNLKDLILSADDLPREPVTVPEWGGVTVYVRSMTAAERDAFEQSVVSGKRTNLDNVRARLCVLCCVDEHGARVFADADADALGGKSAAALDRVFSAAQKLNGMSRADAEDLAKNSGGGPSAA